MNSTLNESVTNATDSMQGNFFPYGEALQKSFLFYEAQRSGSLPNSNRIEWRNDSGLSDGSDVGRDLSGGYHEAGNSVKFSYPIASSLTLLSWGVIEYTESYERADQLDEALDTIRWGTDYLLKTHVADEWGTRELWAQVGDPAIDHSRWIPPESWLAGDRPSFKLDRQNPGTDLAAESAAALASASILFRDTDPNYANQLLDNAIQLYAFADDADGNPNNGKQRELYSESVPAAQDFYPSRGYQDELMWGALWLHKAFDAQGQNSNRYLETAESLYSQGVGWTQSWDEKKPGVAVLLAQETNDPLYRTDVEIWLNHWLNPPQGREGFPQYTQAGLAWLDGWGSLQYSANTAFLAGVYNDTVNRKPQYAQFAETQINYILGDNPQGFSYVVGIGERYPRQPHHRAASGFTDFEAFEQRGLKQSNAHILYGALVGGPKTPQDDTASQDTYQDDRSDFIGNEASIVYNAGLTGALARLYGHYGGNPLSEIQLSRLPGIV